MLCTKGFSVLRLSRKRSPCWEIPAPKVQSKLQHVPHDTVPCHLSRLFSAPLLPGMPPAFPSLTQRVFTCFIFYSLFLFTIILSGIVSKFVIYFICFYVFCLHACMWANCMQCPQKPAEGTISHGMGVNMSGHAGAQNRTRVLCKSSRCSWRLSLSPTPSLLFQQL